MSRRYVTTTTLTIGGQEADLDIRAHVEVEPSRSRGWTASIDGDIEAKVDGAWSVLDEGSSAHLAASEVLEELALEDDSSQCVEASS